MPGGSLILMTIVMKTSLDCKMMQALTGDYRAARGSSSRIHDIRREAMMGRSWTTICACLLLNLDLQRPVFWVLLIDAIVTVRGDKPIHPGKSTGI